MASLDPDAQVHQRQVKLEALCRELLITIGENPDREELQGTPARWARWWTEFIGYDDRRLDTAFPVVRQDQMVVVTGMRVWSLCEHHLLPFWCDLTIGYLADSRILGLSKFARIAHLHAHKLQVQERLVTEIADHVQEATGSESIAVLASGEHLCMTMRGIRTPSLMHSSVLCGRFLDEQACRQEFFSIVERHR